MPRSLTKESISWSATRETVCNPEIFLEKIERERERERKRERERERERKRERERERES